MPEYTREQLSIVADAIREHPQYVYDEGLTIEQIAQALGVSYHGARNYIYAAVEEKIIFQVPRLGRQRYYRLPNASKMPRFSFNPKPRSEKIPLDVAANHLAQSDANFPFLKELPAFPVAIAQMYDIAYRLATGGKIDKVELKQLKLVIERVQTYSRNMVTICQEFIEDERLWDAHSLAEALLMDPISPMTPDQARSLSERLHETYEKGL